MAMFVSAGLLLPAQRDRISGAINPNQRVVLKGNVHFNAQAQYDQGLVDPALQISSASVVLKPSAAQQTALDQLLADQQNPSSPSFHKWLTPEQFADQFNITSADAAKITAWLQSEGLTVGATARGRGWISFSGSAGQVSRALHTEIHRYNVNGEMHFANATEPSVPAALADVVSGFRGLNDFRLKPRLISKHVLVGDYKSSTSGNNYLAPDDVATIYDITPLYNAGIDGSGQKIAIVGQTDIVLSDITSFRSRFNLPTNNPQVVLVPSNYGGSDPGVSQGDLGEADLDLELSGGVARNATIIYVNSQDVILSLIYAVDQNLAPVLSMSYGLCEQENDPTLRFVAQQAVAQGMTFVGTAGDAGAADCDTGTGSTLAPSEASKGKAVDIPAAFPEVTAVGGTQFNEGSGNYWAATNNANGGSALSYIPEMAWNESDETGIAATGGGASMLFTQPAWQAGPGVPSDNARHVPDVAMAAAFAHDGFLVYTGGALYGGNGGTSVAAPTFAGVVALLNQYVSTHGGQAGLGNINPTLYRLAQNTGGVFHDITSGSNIVPCVQSSPDCSNGSFGYSAGSGYDPVTGLGSVDVNNLVLNWNNATASTTTTLAAGSSNVSFSSTVQLTATVTSSTGGSPTGKVSFVCEQFPLGEATVTGGVATLSLNTDLLPDVQNQIFAAYSGDSNFGASSGSTTVNVSVSSGSSAVVVSIYPDPIYPSYPDSSGNIWFASPSLYNLGTGTTTLTGFSVNGVSFASQIASIFGSTRLAANGGTLPTSAAASGAYVAIPNVSGPGATVSFVFSGADSNGRTWSRQFSLPVLGQPLAYSAMSLTGAPATVLKSSNASCPYALQLNLQEQGGFETQLSRFLTGVTNLGTSMIQQVFGATRLAPFGSLQGTLCSTSPASSQVIEIDGADDQGFSVTATLNATYSTSAVSGGAISAAPSPVTMSAASSQSATASVALSLDSGAQWSVSVLPANRTASWLTVSPASGTGPAQITLNASAAGLSNGVYRGVLVIQSANANPQMLNVPVALTVGPSGGTSIGGVAHGASFTQSFAPGMILSIFGTQLAPSAQAAQFVGGVALPVSLAGVSVTVNGVSAPLYYVSPTQLNVQIPYEVGSGPAVLGVNNNGQFASFVFQVSSAAPGIFVDGSGNAVPNSTASPGSTIILFITGEGDETPALATGWTPDPSTALRNLPKPRLPVTVTVGGVAATTTFVGIPSGLTGVTQINYTVPATAPTGVQPVVVTVGGVASKPANLAVQ